MQESTGRIEPAEDPADRSELFLGAAETVFQRPWCDGRRRSQWREPSAEIERSFELGRILAPSNLVREFERTIFREMDMQIEAGSIEKFSHNFRDTEEIYIPRVYWDYTTKSILVMERIDGIKTDQVEELRARGIDRREIALIGLRCFSRQLMEFGFFHADPHPGNTIVMNDGRVSLQGFTRPYAKKLLQRGYEAKKISKHIGRDSRYLGRSMRVMPRFIHDIL